MRTTTAPRLVAVHGPALRHFRTTAGYSIRRLAAVTGADAANLSRLERGHLARVRVDVFNAVLLALEIDDPRLLMANPRSAIPAAA